VWEANYWEWVQQLTKSYTPKAGDVPFDYRNLIDGPAIVGSPAEAVDRISATTELLGLDRMIFMFDLGGIPDDVLFPTLELFGAEVMPALARGG
jgi:alkanesulfonate monooxygenase SsuD/methylene tetrahydromethanopterin reductase-like flavin-dependent oxidoreductase (luciferase family)